MHDILPVSLLITRVSGLASHKTRVSGRVRVWFGFGKKWRLYTSKTAQTVMLSYTSHKVHTKNEKVHKKKKKKKKTLNY